LSAAIGCGVLLCSLSSCMTTRKGEEMRLLLEQRIERVAADNEQRQKDLEAKLAELSENVERTRALLTRDSADVGAQVQTQQIKMSEIEGKLDEITHSLSDLSDKTARTRSDLDDRLGKVGTAKPNEGGGVDPTQVPADKGAHFTAAYEAYKAGEQEKARALFREYVTRYPDDPKAGDAQYWVGATYLVQNKPATSLAEYRKVIQLCPKSPAFDTALYGMADAFFRLHACTDAKGALDALSKRKPAKALDDRAKQLMQQIKDSAKGYCTS
jgi:TolA-binding protein